MKYIPIRFVDFCVWYNTDYYPSFPPPFSKIFHIRWFFNGNIKRLEGKIPSFVNFTFLIGKEWYFHSLEEKRWPRTFQSFFSLRVEISFLLTKAVKMPHFTLVQIPDFCPTSLFQPFFGQFCYPLWKIGGIWGPTVIFTNNMYISFAKGS